MEAEDIVDEIIETELVQKSLSNSVKDAESVFSLVPGQITLDLHEARKLEKKVSKQNERVMRSIKFLRSGGDYKQSIYLHNPYNDYAWRQQFFKVEVLTKVLYFTDKNEEMCRIVNTK